MLNKLNDDGLTFRKDKCQFFKNSLSCLWYKTDKMVLHPSEDKVQAIFQATKPNNVTQLQSFNRLWIFIQNL